MNKKRINKPKEENLLKLKKLCTKKPKYKKTIELWQKLRFQN